MISSIKGNIGHCEAASGAAGLAKLLLMLRRKEIPAQVGFKDINPCFGDLETSGFIIPRRTTAWKHSKKTPRRAVVNNFGAAGSNASLLLEEWNEPLLVNPLRKRPVKRSAHVFALSAKSQTALQTAVRQHCLWLEQSEHRLSLEDVCYTASARRQVYDHRISVACTSVDDLQAKLERCQPAISTPAQDVSSISFVFSGQGGLYNGMGGELMHTCSLFKEIIITCDSIVQGLGYPGILGIFSEDSGRVKPLLDNDEHIIASQCACVALEYALAKMFVSWGVVPGYVMGHR